MEIRSPPHRARMSEKHLLVRSLRPRPRVPLLFLKMWEGRRHIQAEGGESTATTKSAVLARRIWVHDNKTA
jgi:hypothetical protein